MKKRNKDKLQLNAGIDFYTEGLTEKQSTAKLKKFVKEELKPLLEKNGIEIWIDYDLGGGFVPYNERIIIVK